MPRILILGAGVMGSAIAVPAADNAHDVTLVGTHLDGDIIAALKADRGRHPRLGAPLPPGIEPLDIGELHAGHFETADLIILGVSSAGMPWAVEHLLRYMGAPKPIALVTKGLVGGGTERPRTYVESLPEALRRGGLSASPIIGIGGPCIARELAERRPTAVVYASDGDEPLRRIARWMRTSTYRVSTSADHIGVEACAALKNFYAIGVSAMWALHANPHCPERPYAINPAAAVFTQAVKEMGRLVEWMGGQKETAVDLAGLGDLHVTVNGGRNSRLGLSLGQGMSVSEALSGPLNGETVEGVDTGRCLSRAFQAALGDGVFDASAFPLTQSLIGALVENAPFAFDFACLGHA